MSPPPAEPVLLLHGQPGGARDWARVVDALGGGEGVLAIDRPGWARGTAPTDLEGNARAALAALDARGWQRAIVAGHSLGGAVAAWMAAEYPERVSRLVLAAPAANRASLVPLDYWLARPLAGELIGATLLAGAGLALSAAPLRHRLAGVLRLDERYLQATGRALLSPAAWRAFAEDQRALVRDLPALERHLHRITSPTTVVAGSSDRVVPLSSARSLAEAIPAAELVVIPGAGHTLLHHQAAQVAAAIAG